jgi:putative PEP-CTERM system histidine kinase
MTYPTTAALLHGICAVIFLCLAGLTALRRPVSRTGLWLAAALLATALWAAAIVLLPAASALQSVMETLRIAALALFTGHLLRGVMRDRREVPRWVFATPVLVLMLTGILLALLPETASLGLPAQAGRVVMILLAVLGCLMLENLYGNATADSRWHINLLTIGIGAILLYDIVLYADAALFRRASPVLLLARPLVDMLVAPLIALAAGRNRRWLADIQVSRNVIFYSSTLLVSGLFLLSIGAAGEILRNIGVAWGSVLEIALVFGAIVFVTVIFTSGRARSQIRLFFIKNFFAYRYDYRKVWLGFIDTLSSPSFPDEQLRVRVIRAVADTVDTPGGSLWLRDGDDTAFAQVATWNLPVAGGPVESGFAAAFRDGHWIFEFARPEPGVAVPDMLARTPRIWLAVPLSYLGRLLGFILLTEPRAAIPLNWENYDLLRIAGRQVASYLAEEQAARALVEARQLQAYGERFAFVVHDIKNLVSQLSMVVSNGERHAGDPDFQQDVLETVRHSVTSMNRLLAQLRANRAAEPAETVVPALVVKEFLKTWRPRKPVHARLVHDGGNAPVKIGRDAFASALRQLLDNAAEVSPDGAEVRIEVRHESDRAIIDVCDTGDGMSASFIANQLFKPFRSTKEGGYGIGAYQTRALVRAARGELLVLSEPGRGTTMRIILPVEPAALPAEPVSLAGNSLSAPEKVVSVQP